jgi:hypothetical protein
MVNSQCLSDLSVAGIGGSNEMAKLETVRPGHAERAAAPDMTGSRQTCHGRLQYWQCLPEWLDLCCVQKDFCCSGARHTMRVFVAIDLPDHVRRELEALQSALPAGRPVPAENLHLTLSFLGDQQELAVEDAHEALATIRASDLEVQLKSGSTHRLSTNYGPPSDMFATSYRMKSAKTTSKPQAMRLIECDTL